MSIVGITGWLLDRACEIDSVHPGFVGHVFRASGERRHVIAAYLSVDRPAEVFEDDDELGAFLTRAGHDRILQAAFDTVPTGMRSCLARGGGQPFERRFYPYLCALLSTDGRVATRRLLARLDRVDPARLRIARILPDALQCTSLVEALRSVDHARDLARLYRLLIESGVDATALISALRASKHMGEVRKLAATWSLRVAFPPHPIPASTGYTPIETGAHLREIAHRFRNCARGYVARVMEGRSAFALVSVGTKEAVIHLTREDDGWTLDDVYGVANEPPDPELQKWSDAYLVRHGVTIRSNHQNEREWACLRRLTGRYDFDP